MGWYSYAMADSTVCVLCLFPRLVGGEKRRMDIEKETEGKREGKEEGERKNRRKEENASPVLKDRLIIPSIPGPSSFQCINKLFPTVSL